MMNSELNETPETQSPEPPFKPQPPPRKSLTPWVLVLPLALCASALWQSSREPEKPLEALNMSEISVQRVRRKAAALTPPAAPNDSPDGAETERIIFVPDDNGDLKRTIVKDSYPGPTTAWPYFYGSMSAHLVKNILFAKFPQHFPPGSKVLEEAKVESDVVTINFNQQFAKSEFWQGETKTLAAIYSIVNTIVSFDTERKKQNAKAEGAKPKAGGRDGLEYKVRFLIEGKAIPSLGEFDTSEPIESDMGMVAPH